MILEFRTLAGRDCHLHAWSWVSLKKQMKHTKNVRWFGLDALGFGPYSGNLDANILIQMRFYVSIQMYLLMGVSVLSLPLLLQFTTLFQVNACIC